MLARLETMVLMAGMDLPLRAIREQIASAVDLIVHQDRLKDGTRRITNITEVQGMEGDVDGAPGRVPLEPDGRGRRDASSGGCARAACAPSSSSASKRWGSRSRPGIFSATAH